MSRISEKTQNVIKQQIYGVLTDAYHSVFAISEIIGRSWHLVNRLLDEMLRNDIYKIEKATVSNLVCYRLKPSKRRAKKPSPAKTGRDAS